MTTFLAIVMLASPWAAPRHLVFGDGNKLVLWDVQKQSASTLPSLSSVFVRQAVATADGTQVFLIGESPVDHASSLYRWDGTAEHQPTRLGDSHGYHGQLSLSPDEKWIYFTFHEHGGPLGNHAEGAYQQLYRIKVDGQGIERLTNGEGCRLGSCPLRGSHSALVLHANCNGASALETIDLATKEVKAAARETGRFYAVDAAPDGKSALILTSSVSGASVLEWNSSDGQLSPRAELGFGASAQPRYGRTRSEVLYWDGQQVKVATFSTSLKEVRR
ncbi:MAG: hypothetical protein QM723_28790 [Myxococcaceae bacterium]